jgi:hypothetical protein
VKKGILYVQLVNRPGAGRGDAEYRPYGGRFDDRAEGLVVVDALALGEASDNPASLAASEGPIGMLLVPEDPLPRHDVGAGGGGGRPGRRPPGTSCQVLLSARAWYSSIIAVRQLASASALR